MEYNGKGTARFLYTCKRQVLLSEIKWVSLYLFILLWLKLQNMFLALHHFCLICIIRLQVIYFYCKNCKPTKLPFILKECADVEIIFIVQLPGSGFISFIMLAVGSFRTSDSWLVSLFLRPPPKLSSSPILDGKLRSEQQTTFSLIKPSLYYRNY